MGGRLGCTQKFVKRKRENDFLQILRDSRCQKFFLFGDQFFIAMSGDLLITITSLTAENEIQRFPEEELTGAHRSPAWYATGGRQSHATYF